MILFLPVIGNLVCFVTYFLQFFLNNPNQMIEDYEKYIAISQKIDFEKRINYISSIRTVSYSDQISSGSDINKKDVIIDIAGEDVNIKYKILRDSLDDKNSEVVHYAATTLNVLEDEFSQDIINLKDKYIEYNDINALDKLADKYKIYLNSGILVEDLKKYMFNDYISTLEKCLNVIGLKEKYITELTSAYIYLDMLDKASHYNDIGLSNFPDSFCVNRQSLEISYVTKDYTLLREKLINIQSTKPKLAVDLNHLIEFWVN
ncbi:MAG: hypothetical protein WBA54_07850 [Acidaminobacteraceae bacterium]